MSLKPIPVPDLGGVSEVVVIEALVKAGDVIKADTSIVTLESDKATMDVPAGEAGTVKEVKVKAGDKVSAGTTLVILEPQHGFEKIEKPTQAAAEKTRLEPMPAAPASEAPAPQPAVAFQAALIDAADVHAGPAVRRIAREFGIDLTHIKGSGFKQRILKEDIQAYVKAKLSATSSSGVQGPSILGDMAPALAVDFSKFGAIETQPLSRIKKISGKNLHRNWVTIPHVTQFGEADITDLDAYRQKHKAHFEKEGLKLTPLVFIMKAAVEALRKFPTFNASLDANGENLVLKKYFHMGVAVDTPDGLVVPVVRDVNNKGISQLAKELAIISEKARNKQLMPHDMQGGCFTISSLGGIGGTAFTPIINAPEVAILGVSKVTIKPVYQESNWVPRLVLPLSLSYDHRVIDGAEAARFIVYLSEILSDIRHLLL